MRKSEELLTSFVKTISGKPLSLKLRFFDKFVNFIAIIALYVLDKNELWDSLLKGEPILRTIPGNPRILKSLWELLEDYEIVQPTASGYKLNEAYARITDTDRKVIREVVDQHKFIAISTIEKSLQKQLFDFGFIVELIQARNSEKPLFYVIQKPEPWLRLIRGKQLDYEIRLCETLLNLRALTLTGKIPSPFDESYYTGSGESAFRNFTGPVFTHILQQVKLESSIGNTLDIGCGFGDYIDIVHQVFPEGHVDGIELQKKVYKQTTNRFREMPGISIHNLNIFNFHPETRYDLVLLNYVLFYFSTEEKIKLFAQLHDMMADDGTILVCQYYSGIEKLKARIAKARNDFGLSRRIEMHYGNKIAYANTLWNDSSEVFTEAERWDEFIEILSQTGFQVEAITNADRFYYSFFIAIRKKKNGV